MGSVSEIFGKIKGFLAGVSAYAKKRVALRKLKKGLQDRFARLRGKKPVGQATANSQQKQMPKKEFEEDELEEDELSDEEEFDEGLEDNDGNEDEEGDDDEFMEDDYEEEPEKSKPNAPRRAFK